MNRITTRNLIIAFIALLTLSSCSTGFDLKEDSYIYISEGEDYEDVWEKIKTTARPQNEFIFDLYVSSLGYKDLVKTGKYKVSPAMSYAQFIRNLRAGNQTPHKITFNNIRLFNDLSVSISNQTMMNKERLNMLFADSSTAQGYGFTAETFPSMFIPNTYEIYWDMSEKAFMDRMKKEFDAFWTTKRTEKASALGLTPVEVSILASIVEEECMYIDEYPIVAGLYHNRLKRGQLLQADPTVKYAVGDFGLRRILYAHLKVDSPYNTYMHAGLPPGPIRIPSIQGLEAVLNKADHNYLYMVAKEDFSGRHSFSTNLREHERKANLYRAELNKRNIYQ